MPPCLTFFFFELKDFNIIGMGVLHAFLSGNIYAYGTWVPGALVSQKRP